MNMSQATIDRANWPAKTLGNVMQCWRRGISIAVTEEETTALIKAAESPRVLPMTFGSSVRLRPMQHNEWAFRLLAEMRNERADGSAA
jgi:hypothetical protein